MKRVSLDTISRILFHVLRVAPPQGDKEAIGFWMKVRKTQRRAKEINLMTSALKHTSLFPHYNKLSSGDPNPVFLEFIFLKK